MRKDKNYYVYILASQRNGTLYVGVTNSIYRRSFQHRIRDKTDSFTAKHKVYKLVYFEIYKYIADAIEREKQLKKWNRSWKIKLIERENPAWRDLFLDMT